MARVHPQGTGLLAKTLIECSDPLALEGFEGREYKIIYLNWSVSKGLCFKVVDLENGNLTCCLIYLVFMVGISVKFILCIDLLCFALSLCLYVYL